MYFFCRSYFSSVWESPKGNIYGQSDPGPIPQLLQHWSNLFCGVHKWHDRKTLVFSVFVGELHSHQLLVKRKKKLFFFLQREMNALEMLCPLLSNIRNTKLSINGIALLHLLWSFFLHVSPFSTYSTNGTCQVSPFSLSLTCNLIVGLFILSILIQIFRSSDKVNEFERTQLRIPALFR